MVLDVAGVAREVGEAAAPVLWDGDGRSLTRAALLEAVDRRSAELVEADAPGGTIRPIEALADTGGVVELLAHWRAGLTPAPLRPGLTRDERREAVRTLSGAEVRAQAVLWTSGTAGRARGVALGAEGLRAHVAAVRARLRLDGSEVWLATLSPAHVGGLALVARALMTGARLVLPGRFDTNAVARMVEAEGRPMREDEAGRPPVTHLSLVPTQLSRLLRAWGSRPAPDTLRCVLVGGAHAPPDLVETALRAGWPLSLTYGMTEMWSQVATADPEQVRAKPGNVGAPLDGTELRFAEDGEILVRGPTRALSYIGPGAPPLAGPDGWYRTGDFGRLDGEGDLWITGRRSDRIVTGGVNVDPVEIEDVLRAHPTVVDVAVVGVPSQEWGEVVGAVVIPVWGEFTVEEVEAFVRERLSGPKRPRAWRVVHDLPTNPNGKVDRTAARALITPDPRVGP